MTLKDLFDVMWDITEAGITCRNDSKYIHKFIFGPETPWGSGLLYDIKSGRVTAVIGPINAHGIAKGRNNPEIGWGYLEKSIPKELMEAPVVHLLVSSMPKGNGHRVSIDVEIQPLTVEVLKKGLKGWNPVEEEEECKTI